MRHASAALSLGALHRIVVEDRCALAILERIVRELEPYLERAAAYIAGEYPATADDLVQEARIKLWDLDLGRFSQGDGAYLERMLYHRMIDVYETECRDGLTNGRS